MGKTYPLNCHPLRDPIGNHVHNVRLCVVAKSASKNPGEIDSRWVARAEVRKKKRTKRKVTHRAGRCHASPRMAQSVLNIAPTSRRTAEERYALFRFQGSAVAGRPKMLRNSRPRSCGCDIVTLSTDKYLLAQATATDVDATI